MNNAEVFGDKKISSVEVCDFEKLEFQEGNNKIKIQIMKTGKFDHPFGKFEITKKDLKQFADHFKNNTRRVDLAVDYSHRSDEKAAGWFKEISVDSTGNKLFAEIEMTPDGLNAIKNKEFRFFSPEFTFLHTDAETGKKTPNVILGGGLTNRPFLKDMKPVIPLTEQNKTKNERLNKMETISIEAHEGQVKILNERIKELEGKVESLKEDQSNSSKLSEKVTELKSEITKLQADSAKKEKEVLFDKMLTEGKVCEAQRVHYLSGDMAEFVKCQKAVNLVENGQSPNTNTSGSKSAVDQIDELATKMSEDQKIPYGEAVSKVLSENKKLAEDYETEVAL